MTTAAVILAAGGSSRFGGDVNKLVAHFRGRPLVSWAIDHAAEAGLDDLIVVMGAVDVAALASSPARVVPNDAWSQGQATSLQVAIGWAADNGHDAIVPEDATNGWTFDDPSSPTKVLLHGNACEGVKIDKKGSVSFLVGCPTSH